MTPQSRLRSLPEDTSRRIRDAWLEGLSIGSICARFGISRKILMREVADLPKRVKMKPARRTQDHIAML